MFYPVFAGAENVIGAPVSDLSNGLWSLWAYPMHFGSRRAILSSASQCSSGWCLLPADWTGLVWMLPLFCFSGSNSGVQFDIVRTDCMDWFCDVFVVSSLVSKK